MAEDLTSAVFLEAWRRRIQVRFSGESALPWLLAVARSATSRRRSRSGVIAAGVAAIVVSTGAAAFAVAEFQPVTNKTEARCYTVPNLSEGRFTTIAAAGRPGSKAQVQDALSVCAALFRQGFLKVGSQGIARSANGDPNHPVPRLVACTMRDGTASVFPGDRPPARISVCRKHPSHKAPTLPSACGYRNTKSLKQSFAVHPGTINRAIAADIRSANARSA